MITRRIGLREDWRNYTEVEITHNFWEKPISREELNSNTIFSNFKAGNQGTNFSATPKEYEEIERILNARLLDSKKRFWLYAPGEKARLWSECWKNGFMALGWDDIGDFRKFTKQEEIKDHLVKENTEKPVPVNDSLALWEFAGVMKPGDVVIAKEGRAKYIGYGVVEGDYTFDPKRKEYSHVRKVSWKKRGGGRGHR